MVRQERILNAAETTLNGALTAIATSVTVTDGSVFPAEGDYRLHINDEIVLVTARATNVLTIQRGIEGTTAAAHSNGDAIKTLITKGAIDQYIKDFVDPHAFDRPPQRLVDINGNTLTSSDFTNLNMGTGTVIDDTGGSISISMQNGAAPNLRAMYKSAPTAPYKLTCHVLMGTGANDAPDNAVLIGFRESSSGKLSFISYHYANSAFSQYLNNPTTSGPANSASQAVGSRADYWLQIENDDTDLFYRLSADGYNWWELHNESKTFHFDTGPDGIFWGGDNQGNNGEYIHLLSWAEE